MLQKLYINRGHSLRKKYVVAQNENPDFLMVFVKSNFLDIKAKKPHELTLLSILHTL